MQKLATCIIEEILYEMEFHKRIGQPFAEGRLHPARAGFLKHVHQNELRKMGIK